MRSTDVDTTDLTAASRALVSARRRLGHGVAGALRADTGEASLDESLHTLSATVVRHARGTDRRLGWSSTMLRLAARDYQAVEQGALR
jgi:hypothetical protein